MENIVKNINDNNANDNNANNSIDNFDNHSSLNSTGFSSFDLSVDLKNTLDSLGFEVPTEIQEKALPLILGGRDVIAESATGSGKTLAFALGFVDSVVQGAGVQVVVLTPTRELAEQVNGVVSSLIKNLGLSSLAIYGGVAIDPQIFALRNSEIVIATPGRFLDHLQRGTIDTSKVKVVVLDEADRMLDMGFVDDVERILFACSSRSQTLLFSATMSLKVKSLADKHLNNPARINVRNTVDPSKLSQVYYNVSKNLKLSLLVSLLKDSRGLTMVFCNTRSTTDFVARNLLANDINAHAIHGGLSQNKRLKTLDSFDKGSSSVLVCTDVAARGLDISGVSLVVNYEVPKDPTDYVHRIGRTARAGNSGRVVNLISDLDHASFSKIFDAYKNFDIKSVPLPRLERIRVSSSSSGNGFSRGKNFRSSSGRFASNGSFNKRSGFRKRRFSAR